MSEAPTRLMTSEEFFALPDEEGVERDLICGVLVERRSDDPDMTKRNPGHSGATAALSRLIGNWSATLPRPRGKVFDGEAYFRLRRDPETNVGIDVAYASPDQVAALNPRDRYIDGPPILAVEVLSPNDKQEDTEVAIDEYLACGVRAVWVVNPFRQTVLVCRPDAEPKLFTASQELAGDSYLPGFRCRVAEIFED
jgi:Uma2 family endonuclease